MLIQSQPKLDFSAMVAVIDDRKKFKKDVICSHCNKIGHPKEKCYRLNGFPEDFKFNKGKNACKRGKAVNNVSVVEDIQPAKEK